MSHKAIYLARSREGVGYVVVSTFSLSLVGRVLRLFRPYADDWEVDATKYVEDDPLLGLTRKNREVEILDAATVASVGTVDETEARLASTIKEYLSRKERGISFQDGRFPNP